MLRNFLNNKRKDKLNILRKKYPRFIYKRFDIKKLKDQLLITFHFNIEPDVFFKPQLIIDNISKLELNSLDEDALKNLVFHLGLIEMLSYWKSTCSQKIIIESGFLNKKQVSWWKDLIQNGMGQYFYENKINFQKPNFIKIECTSNKRYKKIEKKLSKERVLLPLGEGKDSLVTTEILKLIGKGLIAFSLNPTLATKKLIKIADLKNHIIVSRKIDNKLLELNRQGFLNSHTPFSAYLAFLSALCSVLFNSKFIVLSNEKSSNEGNVKYLGRTINHQYSKSFDFEKKFRSYSKKYLVNDIEYFSFLRPLYEIQIAKMFSKYPKYFNTFISCNDAHKTHSGTKKATEKWCGRCPKCLFVFTILYPFIDEQKLIEIFNKNLFENKKLIPLLKSITGFQDFKPFECVGTEKETIAALYLSLTKNRKVKKIPVLLQYFENHILSKNKTIIKQSKIILKSWNKEHNLPVKFEKVLKANY